MVLVSQNLPIFCDFCARQSLESAENGVKKPIKTSSEWQCCGQKMSSYSERSEGNGQTGSTGQEGDSN